MNRFDPFRQDPMAMVCDKNENCDRWERERERESNKEICIWREVFKGCMPS